MQIPSPDPTATPSPMPHSSSIHDASMPTPNATPKPLHDYGYAYYLPALVFEKMDSYKTIGLMKVCDVRRHYITITAMVSGTTIQS